MTHQDWTDRLRDRMADYEAAAPEGLWADIEQSLSQPKARITSLWRRWVSVAAVIALLMGIGWWLWPVDDQPSRIADSPKPIANSQKPKADSLRNATLTPSGGRTPKANSLRNATLLPSDGRTPTSTPPIKKKARSINVGLYANNGLLAYHHTNGVLMSDEMAKRYDYSEYLPTRSSWSGEPIYLTGYEEHQHHDHPVSYGLTVAYPLTNRWTIESGLVYTRLHSTFTNIMQQTQINKEQTLHYLGLPLHVQYLLLNNKQWKVYAKAGTQVDWNIRAKCETEGVDTQMAKDNTQWSLGAAVGIEYDIVPPLGLYVEPGFRYYIDNGSKVQNFFKDQPANWSLQLGIRLRLNQR